MKFKIFLFCAFLMVFISSLSIADSVRISQVDTGDLLLSQQVRLFLSITNDKGLPLTNIKRNQIKISESINGRSFQPINSLSSFESGANNSNGVSFLLLIDNSESMYWTLNGDRTNSDSKRRMTIAKKAVRSFFRSITNPKDTVGVGVYNSYYQLLSKPSSNISEVEKQLNSISRPKGDAIYSEIYGSLALAVQELEIVKGRKAVIILSDGVNNPAYRHTNKINQQFGMKYVPYTKPLDVLQLEGISLYVINFGSKKDKKDRHLKTIASQSGGVTFDAHSQSQLNKVYARIIDQIQKEYVVTYTATMDLADQKYVKVDYQNDSKKDSVTRKYLSSTVFGQPSAEFSFIYLILVVVAAGLLWLLSRFKFEKQRAKPSLEVLNAGAGKLSTQVLTLGNEETVIGSSQNADMTIAGLPAVEEQHATVAFDPKSNQYTLIGSGKMMVNNQMVTTKILEPGDLINIDGATMVFDEGTDK